MTTPQRSCCCTIKYVLGGGCEDYEIVYCTLHANASRLRDALEESIKMTRELRRTMDADHWYHDDLKALDERLEALLTSCRDQKGESSAK